MAAVTAAMAFTAGPAFALPGDRAIDDSSPFRLDERNLEPGCFHPGRGPVDLDTPHRPDVSRARGHRPRAARHRRRRLAVQRRSGARPSAIDGYEVYNTFETAPDDAADIDPNYTAVDLFAPDSNDLDGPDPIDTNDVIVCVSDHGVAAERAVPVGGRRPRVCQEPADPRPQGHGLRRQRDLEPEDVQDRLRLHRRAVVQGSDLRRREHVPVPPTVPTPTRSRRPRSAAICRDFVSLFPRADGDYDARRVNDVDKARSSGATSACPPSSSRRWRMTTSHSSSARTAT